MRDDRIRTLVEIALSVALAAVLALWKIPLPWLIAGGSISLAMLPLFVVSMRRGLVAGITAGLLFGVIDYFMEPWFVHPVQVFLDYGVAFAACGLAGLGAASVNRALSEGLPAAASARMIPWLLLGTAGRFAAAVVSGIVFFAANAPEGQPVWLYSILYNASYILPSALLCCVLTFLLVPVLYRAVPVSAAAPAGRTA